MYKRLCYLLLQNPYRAIFFEPVGKNCMQQVIGEFSSYFYDVFRVFLENRVVFSHYPASNAYK